MIRRARTTCKPPPFVPGGPFKQAVVVQADELLHLSTTIVAPTSTSARPATFRPVINVDGEDMRVLVEQTTVIAPQRLGRSAVCGRPGARPALVSIAAARRADERGHELDRLVIVESLFLG